MQRRDVAGHAGLASHFVEGDLLGAVARGGGDRDGADHGIGVSGSPLQRLHPAHRSAGDGEQGVECRRNRSASSASAPCRLVITGNDMVYGQPVAGLSDPGPVVPRHPPSTLEQITKYMFASNALPGPIMLSHQPGLPVAESGRECPNTDYSMAAWRRLPRRPFGETVSSVTAYFSQEDKHVFAEPICEPVGFNATRAVLESKRLVDRSTAWCLPSFCFCNLFFRPSCRDDLVCLFDECSALVAELLGQDLGLADAVIDSLGIVDVCVEILRVGQVPDPGDAVHKFLLCVDAKVLRCCPFSTASRVPSN